MTAAVTNESKPEIPIGIPNLDINYNYRVQKPMGAELFSDKQRIYVYFNKI